MGGKDKMAGKKINPTMWDGSFHESLSQNGKKRARSGNYPHMGWMWFRPRGRK